MLSSESVSGLSIKLIDKDEYNKEVAEKVVHKYSNKHIYCTPYDDLYSGELAVKEMPIVDKYEDINQGIIDWGESNIKKTDY